jgi:hypothetical protein
VAARVYVYGRIVARGAWGEGGGCSPILYRGMRGVWKD